MAKYKRKKLMCANGGDISYNGNPVSDESKDMPENPDAKKSVNAGQVLGYAQAGLGAYNQLNSAYGNPNATDTQKGDAAYGAGVSAVGAINPVIGGFINIGDAVGKPIKQGAERTDAQGNLLNENKAKAGYVAGTLFNPAKSLSNTLNNKSASGLQKGLAIATGGISNVGFTNQYTSQLEKDNKAAISEQQALEAQNVAAQQAAAQEQQDYINQQIQAGLGAQQQQQAGVGRQYAMGGKMGKLTEFSGNTHENGGIDLGGKAEVEDKETRGPENTEMSDYIYSDRLKVPGRKLTFAKASKMIESKYSKRDNDKMSSEQKERELMALMNNQESVRQKMMSSAYKRAFGGSLSEDFATKATTVDSANKSAYPVYQTIDGVPIKGYVNTDPASFSKLDRTGANMINLAGAQPVPQSELAANMNTGNYFGNYSGNARLNPVGTNDFRTTKDATGRVYYWKGTTPITEAEYKPTFANGGKIKSYDEEVADINAQYAGTKYDPTMRRGVNNLDYNSLYGIGNFLGAGYDIYRGLKGGDPVNYERINPELVNYQQSRDLAARNLQTGYNSTVGNIRSVVGNPAQYLNLVTQVAANRDNQLAETITKSQEAESNTNAQIRNQAKAANAQTQRLEADARQMEKDQSGNLLASGISGLGTAIAGTGRDKQLKISQEESKKFIGSVDFSPIFDKKGKITGYKHRLNGTTYKIQD